MVSILFFIVICVRLPFIILFYSIDREHSALQIEIQFRPFYMLPYDKWSTF